MLTQFSFRIRLLDFYLNATSLQRIPIHRGNNRPCLCFSFVSPQLTRSSGTTSPAFLCTLTRRQPGAFCSSAHTHTDTQSRSITRRTKRTRQEARDPDYEEERFLTRISRAHPDPTAARPSSCHPRCRLTLTITGKLHLNKQVNVIKRKKKEGDIRGRVHDYTCLNSQQMFFSGPNSSMRLIHSLPLCYASFRALPVR